MTFSRRHLLQTLGASAAAVSCGTLAQAQPPGSFPDAPLLPSKPAIQPSHSLLALVYSSEFLSWPGSKSGTYRETPIRLAAIIDHIRKDSQLKDLAWLDPMEAPLAAIEAIHDPAYVRMIEQSQLLKSEILPDPKLPKPMRLFQTAVLSAGSALLAVDRVMDRSYPRTFSLGRPPGHHAQWARGKGFCFFNNVAIAARYAQQRHGLRRIAIVDWDVHHGDGTQKAFYNDSSVLYLSTHQEGIFPRTGRLTESGVGQGLGFTVNAPLLAHSGDRLYAAIFGQLFQPILQQFQPQLILVSAGQDAHIGENLSQMNLTCQGFRAITEHVKNWANRWCGGRLVLCLEGGYVPDKVGTATHEIVRTLMDLPPHYSESVTDPGVAGLYGDRLKLLLKYHRQFWPDLNVEI